MKQNKYKNNCIYLWQKQEHGFEMELLKFAL